MLSQPLGNFQQEVEGSSPVQLLVEGKRIISSIVQTLDQTAISPMLEDSSGTRQITEWDNRLKANLADVKQADANGGHQVATYFDNPATLNETLTVKPSEHNLGRTHLITPFEQDDKEMPKARRSQSVGQFPSTPSKHKVGNGNSKSLPPGKHKSSPASLTNCAASAWILISLARIASLILISSSLMMLSRSIIGTSVD